MGKFIGQVRLPYLWEKIKATFAKKSELAAHPTARIYMGSCSTAAATNPKVCTVEDFPLDAEGKPLVGTLISVKFSATNTSTSTTPQLNVNETGAIRIWYNNAVLATEKSAYAGYANRYINYMYDGTYWVFLGHSTDNNTTYSALTQAKIDAGTETTGRLISADLLRDNFYTEGEVDTLLGSKANSNDLATVATSGSYNDLDDTPTIPAAVTETTVSNWGFTKNTGTVTGVKMNGTTKGTSGLVNLGTVLTEHQDISGKQDVISDLATIRSGASAGATAYQKPSGGIPKADLASAVQTSLGKADTAVQPAAMNTALAAKQDTLTFDNTPTANSNNPVKSGGVKTAIDAKQDTISTVNVTVDNNTGTPSGSASVSGGTLSLSFQNLKGATGATGPQGIQGVRGVQGPKGDTGVTGDASSLAIIHGIDKTTSYGTTDVCGADAAQALLNEIEGGFYY